MTIQSTNLDEMQVFKNQLMMARAFRHKNVQSQQCKDEKVSSIAQVVRQNVTESAQRMRPMNIEDTTNAPVPRAQIANFRVSPEYEESKQQDHSVFQLDSIHIHSTARATESAENISSVRSDVETARSASSYRENDTQQKTQVAKHPSPPPADLQQRSNYCSCCVIQ